MPEAETYIVFIELYIIFSNRTKLVKNIYKFASMFFLKNIVIRELDREKLLFYSS